VSFVGDVVDLLDAHSPAAAETQAPPPAAVQQSEWWWSQVEDAAAMCMALAAQLAAGGGGVGCVLPAMRRLAELAAEATVQPSAATAAAAAGVHAAVWCNWVPELTVLAVNSTEQDRCGLFALVADAINTQQQQKKKHQQHIASKQQWSTPEAALLAVPLLHSLVLAPGSASKRWATALLAAAQNQTQPWRTSPQQHSKGKAASASQLQQLCCQGELAVVAGARRLLASLWPAQQPAAADSAVEAAVGWLQSLAAAITHARELAAAAASSSNASAFSVALPSARQLRQQEESGEAGCTGSSAELSPAAAALLGALLLHYDARVVDAAARCLRQLVLTLPASAPVFLPPLLMQLRRFSAMGVKGGLCVARYVCVCVGSLGWGRCRGL